MQTDPYLLATDRLGFRHYRPDDAPHVQQLFDDDYSRQFYPEHATLDKATAWITWNLKNYEIHGFGLWALELLATGQFAGDAGLTLQQVEGTSMLEIGYHIHHALRGQGLATEAAAACRDWSFRHTEHDSVCSIVHPQNKASIRVASRIHAERRSFQGKSTEMLLFYTTRASTPQLVGAQRERRPQDG